VVILCNFTKSKRCVDKNKFILGQLYRVENLQMANEKVKTSQMYYPPPITYQRKYKNMILMYS